MRELGKDRREREKEKMIKGEREMERERKGGRERVLCVFLQVCSSSPYFLYTRTSCFE